jgi:hypothetical protein
VAAALALAATLALGACQDGFFFDPAEPGPVSVDLQLEVPALLQGGGAAAAYDQVDRAIVRLLQVETLVLADTVPVDPSGGSATVRLDVPLDQPRDFLLRVELQSNARDLFRGGSAVSLRPGELSSVTLALDPVPGGLDVSGVDPAFEALGDRVLLRGALLFATGDTIDGRFPTWSSRNPSVVEVRPSFLPDVPDTAIAVSEGSTVLDAVNGEFTGSTPVAVEARVASIQVTPPSVELQADETAQLSAVARDVRGNVLPRTPVWSSSDATVASVSPQGLVTGQSAGSATIRAEVGDVAGTAAVEVVVPLPVVTTDPATQVGIETATLVGTVDTRGSAGSAFFEWSSNPTLSGAVQTSSESLDPVEGDQAVTRSIQGLSPGQTYYFRIVASNTGGQAVGAIRSFTTDDTPPSAPTGLGFSADPSSVTLSWTDTSPNETSFEIQRAVQSVVEEGGPAAQVAFEPLATVPAGTTVFTDEAPPASSILDYRVRACSAAGCSGFSDPVGLLYLTRPGVRTLPPAFVSPSVLEMDGDVNPAGLPTEARFVWSDNSSFDGAQATPWTSVGSDFADVGFSQAISIIEESVVYYVIQARNSQGTSQGAVIQTAIPSLNAPSLTLDPDTLSVQLDWVSGGSATRFEIERGIDVGGVGEDVAAQASFISLATVSGGARSYLDVPQPGDVYLYRVRACAGDRCSPYSNTPQVRFRTTPGVATEGPGTVIDTGIERTYQMQGRVNPSGWLTEARFVWSDNSGFSAAQATSWEPLGVGFDDLHVSASGTVPSGSPIFYYVEARNSAGSSLGSVWGT